MTPRQLRKFCRLKPDAQGILKAAMEELGLSARALDKVLRVARTIADLEGADEILPQHIAEAVGHRSLDRSGGCDPPRSSGAFEKNEPTPALSRSSPRICPSRAAASISSSNPSPPARRETIARSWSFSSATRARTFGFDRSSSEASYRCRPTAVPSVGCAANRAAK
jgi:hypothetical protein